ncbi:hypothetical protein [Joostella sp.]|uniref:hypothetical protein n=1 Tax=Joostella sp. TaxID=2231138 RepID=UPI003A8FEF5B
MYNPYKPFLNSFFEIITDFKHSSKRVNKVLLDDVKKHTSKEAIYSAGTSLIIGDWTGPTDNGWKLSFHTGIDKFTVKENYKIEIEKILSREFGLAFSQCYEAFETFLKDCIDSKIIRDPNFKQSLNFKNSYSRKELKGGDELFKLIKKASNNLFNEYSRENNCNFKFKELFKVYSEVRHSITHSQRILTVSKIPKTPYYVGLFEHLFPNNKLEGETIEIKLNYEILNRNLIYFSEFAFQIFKILSQSESYEWKH